MYIDLGGLSHLSNQYGFSADNVVNFEVVLANATLVVANASLYSDLFWALKGGSNNFGKQEFKISDLDPKETSTLRLTHNSAVIRYCNAYDFKDLSCRTGLGRKFNIQW